MFKGSLAGQGQDNAKKTYQRIGDEKQKAVTYSQTFKNNRAQYYSRLADRCYNTFRCVVRGEYVDPDEMISFDSEGVEDIATLRAELTRIPKKDNANGLIQICSKKEMKSMGIDSPNMGDSVMQTMFIPTVIERPQAAAPLPTVNHWN